MTTNESDRRAYASELRSMIQHENQLTNNRMGWLLVFQGLLFAALGQTKDDSVIVFSLAVAGVVSAVSFFLILEASYDARQALKNRWQSVSGEVIAPVHAGQLRPESKLKRVEALLFPWRVLPAIFFVAWFVLGPWFVLGQNAGIVGGTFAVIVVFWAWRRIQPSRDANITGG